MESKDQEVIHILPVDRPISTETVTVQEKDGVVTTRTLRIINSRKIDGITTVQNIYHKQDGSTSDEGDINFVRKNSKRRSLNKEAYIRLHKNITNRKSIEVLKGRYESPLQITETEIVKEKVNGNAPVLREKETVPNETILRSTRNIEDLQNRLSAKLSEDSVQLLKVKYSPSSFGYSNTDLAPEQLKGKPKLPERPKKIPPKPPTRTSTLPKYKKQDSYEFQTQPAHEVILRSSSEDSIEKLETFMSEFTMDPKREVKERKRTSSFRKILSGSLFSKDKKKSDKKGGEDKTKSKKTENVVLADNVQNEQTFNKNSVQRHTVDNHYSKQPKKSNSDLNTKKEYVETTTNNLNEMEKKYAEMHINQFNKIKASFSNPENFATPSSETYHYGHENNKTPSTIDKYIDTSSSSNTLESIDRSTYQNALIAQAELKQMREKELLSKQKDISAQTDGFRNQTPPRAKETYQNVQLVKPKALIPINSERALPNPYHNGQGEMPVDNIKKSTERNLDIDEKDYATKIPVYNRQNDFNDVVYEFASNKTQSQQEQRQYSPNLTKSSNSSSNQNSPSSPSFSARSSPRSPTLEGSKLRLPSNREKVNLQPRIKSPIPQPKVSTEKIIATELLKNKTESKKSEKSLPLRPQKIHDDYMDGNIYEPKPVSSQIVRQSPTQATVLKPPEIRSAADAFEAAKWHQRQRELASSPASTDSPQVFADVMVHADPDMKRNSLQYSSLPVTMRKTNQDAVNLRQRPVTPVKRVPSTASLQQSPQKHEIRQSVELYCWKEIQKMKEKQDKELKYQLQYTPYGYVEDPIIQRRSRSVEPVQQRNTKRSTSLPREAKGNTAARTYYREPIPENQPIVYKENDIYAQKNPNFLRNSPQRRSVTGMTSSSKTPQMYEGYYANSGEVPYRPIFNRGSLSPQLQSEAQAQLQKKVSFNGNRNLPEQQPWPTRNGYVQSPPQRRLEKTMSVGDDEVFLRDSQIKQMNEQIQRQMVKDAQYSARDSISSLPHQINLEESPYGTKMNQIPVQNNVMYVTKPQEKIVSEPLYVTRQNKQNITELSKQKQENLQNIYGTKQQPDVDPLYVKQNYPNRSQQLVLVQDVRDSGPVINEPTYGFKQLVTERYYNNNIIADSPYGTRRIITTNPVKVTKHVTVTNKVCDIYGNIHDNGAKIPVSPANNGQIPQTGVIYGQLQGNVVGRPPQYQSYNQMPSNFVRGTRLTASANDMYRRYPNDVRYREVVYEEGPYGQHGANFNPNAPLPPTPNESKLQFLQMRRNNNNKTYPHASDTESDTSEVRRIMNRNYHGGNGNEEYPRPSVVVYEAKYEYNTEFLAD